MEQPEYSQELQSLIDGLPKEIGETNTKLLLDFLPRYRATAYEPTDSRCKTTLIRLKSISKMLGNKAFDALTENDLVLLNNKMRERQMKSANDYRKSIKSFYRLTNKKKFFDLIESEFLQNRKRKASDAKSVDASKFWNKEETNRYLIQSQEYGLRQQAWAALWLSSGARPAELLNLHKKDLVFEEAKKGEPTKLIITIQSGKTGGRIIPFFESEAIGIWNYCKEYVESLKDNALLFDYSYNYALKVHNKICHRAKIPKEKDTKFYVMRKACLTRFYSENDLVRAAAMAGHCYGSNSMKNYIALTDKQLTSNKKDFVKISQKVCPNPRCNFQNPAHLENCQRCSSPLSKEKFAEIIESNMADLVETRLQLFKRELELKIMEISAKK